MPQSFLGEVKLVRAASHNLGAFKLSEASLLRDGLGTLSHLQSSFTNQPIPVPYGSLIAYAQHLRQEWGEDAYVVLMITPPDARYLEPDWEKNINLDEWDRQLQPTLDADPNNDRAVPLVERPGDELPPTPSTCQSPST
jgi:hypothetical protein